MAGLTSLSCCLSLHSYWHHQVSVKLKRASIKLKILVVIFSTIGSFALCFIALEIIFENRKPQEFPFYNVLYPYVMFRPRANDNWNSEKPTVSSHNTGYALVYTNEDSLRIESPNYKLKKEKPPGQIRIAMIGGSTVHIGTSFEVTLPGSLKES